MSAGQWRINHSACIDRASVLKTLATRRIPEIYCSLTIPSRNNRCRSSYYRPHTVPFSVQRWEFFPVNIFYALLCIFQEKKWRKCFAKGLRTCGNIVQRNTEKMGSDILTGNILCLGIFKTFFPFPCELRWSANVDKSPPPVQPSRSLEIFRFLYLCDLLFNCLSLYVQGNWFWCDAGESNEALMSGHIVWPQFEKPRHGSQVKC